MPHQSIDADDDGLLHLVGRNGAHLSGRDFRGGPSAALSARASQSPPASGTLPRPVRDSGAAATAPRHSLQPAIRVLQSQDCRWLQSPAARRSALPFSFFLNIWFTQLRTLPSVLCRYARLRRASLGSTPEECSASYALPACSFSLAHFIVLEARERASLSWRIFLMVSTSPRCQLEVQAKQRLLQAIHLSMQILCRHVAILIYFFPSFHYFSDLEISNLRS